MINVILSIESALVLAPNGIFHYMMEVGMAQVIEGYVERVVFRNSENGYTVISLSVGEDEVVCVGNFPMISEGECIRAEGSLISHPIYGEQFLMDSYELKVNGKNIDTPPKELELLYYLASNPNRVYTRDQLLDEVWGFEYYGDSRTIDVHIKRLREKLEGVSDKWTLKTVWGVGYKFEAEEEE